MASIIVPDRTLTIGEKTRVIFDLSPDARELEVTGGFNGLDRAPAVDVSRAYGTFTPGTWWQPAGQWTAEFVPNDGIEQTGCYIRFSHNGFTRWNGIYYPPRTLDSETFDIDTKRPTIVGTPTITDRYLTTNEVATISFTFHERVQNFTVEDLSLSMPDMGRLENLRSDDGINWRVDLRANVAANIDNKNLQVRLHMAGLNDMKGNAGAAGAGVAPVILATYDIDSRPPSATITVTPNPVTNDNDRLVTVTITFDEEVSGFTANNIDLSDAHVAARPGADRTGALVRSADGRTYTITYTAASDTEDATNTVRLLNLNTIRDTAGNAATVNPTSNNFEIDTRAPTVTITMD